MPAKGQTTPACLITLSHKRSERGQPQKPSKLALLSAFLSEGGLWLGHLIKRQLGPRQPLA